MSVESKIYTFKMSLMLKEETTGELIRDVNIDVTLDTSDGCSMDYIKECVIAACNSTINVINDV
ncbi:hypothetical protein CLTEP_26190 [Clostridium tepidiprofundi DSM 19306]|uniref:Uncharacterized protein n=1 Tax=Clostridium tepidiprofundi DSM 19306 TaxID=1121338 RepID=A0A151ASA7_9CLOT|nr:hypothetical protein [Clostridium tepidiprofundi]KYH30495.1 hypothetical protein CLTEP_26190 [Clostridium tepidiprofundi DSM 19306]